VKNQRFQFIHHTENNKVGRTALWDTAHLDHSVHIKMGILCAKFILDTA